jgi:LPS export ABC transporter protein LptC
VNQSFKILWIGIGLILSLMLFYSCTNDYNEILSDLDYVDRPILEVENLNVVYTDSGEIAYRVTAPIVEHYTHLEEKPYELYPKGLTFESFSEYPTVESSLMCNYAIKKIDDNLWEVRDDVVIVTLEGDTVKTEQMFWDMNEERIYSDKYVSIRTKNEILYGEGFESDQSFSNGRILNTKGSVYIDDEE